MSTLVEEVAKALHRQSRVEEWERSTHRVGPLAVDLETYLGWHPWDGQHGQGSDQEKWRQRAQVAIAAYEGEIRRLYNERLEQARQADVP